MKKRRTTEQYLDKLSIKRLDKALTYNYSKVVYESADKKIVIICNIHGEFLQRPGDHMKGSGCPQCGRLAAISTNLQKYGTPNPASSNQIKLRIKNKFIEKYGVDNPSKSLDIKRKKIETCNKNYGVDNPNQSTIIKDKKMKNSIKKYGVPYPMQNKEIARKGTATKIQNGGFSKSNSSKEASEYIKKYITNQNYTIDQCAYADSEIGLHEWGIYHNGRWVLFDLVVFESGHRGDRNKIIEILEYHGPFHYVEDDVKQRGSELAYPWKSNKTTIEESYLRDKEKENLANKLTSKYTIVWSTKSENRKQGDL